MITRDLDAFLAFARTATTDFGPATARAAVSPAKPGASAQARCASEAAMLAQQTTRNLP